MFKKRIGPDPHEGGRVTKSKTACPDIWELDNGDFAIIGITASHLKDILPPTAGCGDDESIIIIPRDTLTRARNDIPVL